MATLFFFLTIGTAIAFIVFWWKKRSARKAAGEDYQNDPDYQSVSKKKRIIGIVCAASLVLFLYLCQVQVIVLKIRQLNNLKLKKLNNLLKKKPLKNNAIFNAQSL